MLLRLCIACCLFFAVANVALGDDEAAFVAKKLETKDLVGGDFYEVALQRGPIRLTFTGWLSKANEKWLVLNTGYQQKGTVEFIWIPRAIVANFEHYKKLKPVVAIESEYPRSTGKADVLLVRGDVFQRRHARVAGVKDTDLVLEDEKIPLSDVLCVSTVEPIRYQQGTGGNPGTDNNRQDGDPKDENAGRQQR
ncbi:MAG TPA: hypothetical protein VGN12_02340 [Pirellulales bacterium]|jgi:hypothetical protein